MNWVGTQKTHIKYRMAETNCVIEIHSVKSSF